MGLETVATVVGIASGVAGIGSTIYGFTQAEQANDVNIPPPPRPAGYISYDQEGIPTVQRWDESLGAYVTEYDPMPIPEPPEKNFGLKEPQNTSSEKYPARLRRFQQQLAEKRKEWRERWQKEYEAHKDDHVWWRGLDPSYRRTLQAWHRRKQRQAREKEARAEIRSRMLANLNKTPEERLKQYEEYARTFSEAMHKDVDEQYRKAKQAELESMEARGLTGSRAYVDTLAELEKSKREADVDIARQATLAKEDLAQRDKNFWLQVLGQLDAGARADTLTSMQRNYMAMSGARMGNAAVAGQYAGLLNRYNLEYQARQQRARNWIDTGAGLLYLYGAYGKGKKGGGASPLTSGSPASLGEHSNPYGYRFRGLSQFRVKNF